MVAQPPAIPEPKYKQADHPRLKVNEWRPEAGAERINDFILMSSGVTNGYVVTGDDGDVVINTGMPDHAPRYRERFEQLLGRKLNVKKLIFTQDHMDQTGGWEVFNDSGAELIGQRDLEIRAAERTLLGPFFALRTRRVLRAISDKFARESGRARPRMPKAVKPTTVFTEAYGFDFSGRRFELISTPSGETHNAICIWLPNEKVLFTGNFLSAVLGTMPVFYTMRGDRQRSVPGFLRELRHLIDLRPELLITGHGDPLKGQEHIRVALTRIFDAVTYLHDETVRRMNAGEGLHTIMQSVRLPPELTLSPLGRGPLRWYVRAIWEEYSGWFHQELTSELYATPASAIWPTLARMAGGAGALADQAESFLQAGEPERALHMIEIALAAAPQNAAIRATEARILVALINNTGGEGFDEIGWLETKLTEALTYQS